MAAKQGDGNDERTPRSAQTREAERRWTPTSVLPEPQNKKEGFVYRWVRISAEGVADAENLLKRQREGWEPVKASEEPTMESLANNPQFRDNIVIGTNMLMRCPAELMRQRDEYYREVTSRQLESVHKRMQEASDSRVPLETYEDSSSVTFGAGKR